MRYESLYWSNEIGMEYPNALKKRLILIAMEDTCNADYVFEVLYDRVELPRLLFLRWSLIVFAQNTRERMVE
jgi:hypothetical protein